VEDQEKQQLDRVRDIAIQRPLAFDSALDRVPMSG
jgi:hypothetical protein